MADKDVMRIAARNGLLSNPGHPIEWKKAIVWCDELGWEIFPILVWVMLSGSKGIDLNTLNLLMGNDDSFDFLIKMQTLGLVRRFKAKEDGVYRFKATVRQAHLPPTAFITDEGTVDARKTMLELAQDRANQILGIGVPGRGNAIAKDLVIMPSRASAERSKPRDPLTIKLDKLFKKKKKKVKKSYPKINPDSIRPSLDGLWDSPRRILDNEPQKPKKPVVTHSNEPSTYPRLSGWKEKANPHSWTKLEWVGYWLHRWREYYGQEDPTFVGHSLARTIRQAKNKKGYIDDPYWELGIKIESFRDSDKAFRSDSVGLKEYIDWLFDEFLKESDWFKTPLMSHQAFRVSNNTFLTRFKVRVVKKRTGGDSKGKGKWRPWGYED